MNQAPPRYFSARYELLCLSREIVCTDAILTRLAINALRAKADEGLRVKPFSVLDKSKTPPSGDKHDYFSIAPYWWPDATQSAGAPYVRKDGYTNPESTGPEGDATSRLALLEAVRSLGFCYFFLGDERYARKAAELIRVWFLNSPTRMNPNMRFAQAVPGVSEGRSYGIIQTRGFLEVLDVIGFLSDYSGWTTQDQHGMISWCSQYLEWLETSEQGIEEAEAENNHGTWFDVQCIGFALFCGRADKARGIAEHAKIKRLEAQIANDGSQPFEMIRTKSFFYHCFNMEGMMALARVSEHAGVDLWNYGASGRKYLRAALDYLAPYANPANVWPTPQIVEIDRTALYPLLNEAAYVYRETAYLDTLQHLPVVALESSFTRLLYPFQDVLPAALVGSDGDSR